LRPDCLASRSSACAMRCSTCSVDISTTRVNDSWSRLPTACRVRTQGECPVGAEMTFSTFPEALQWFLGEHGYISKVYVAPLNATGPSYDCGAARTPSERAICRSPELAVLDRTLAVAYTRATALSHDRTALRAAQGAFHETRRDQDDSVRLASLYETRIDELLAID